MRRRIGRLFDGRDVREYDAETAAIEGLLGLPLRHLDAVHRMRTIGVTGGTRPALAICARLSMYCRQSAAGRCPTGYAPSRTRSRHISTRSCRLPSRYGRRKACQRMLAGFECTNDIVKTRQFGHFLKSPWMRAAS